MNIIRIVDKFYKLAQEMAQGILTRIRNEYERAMVLADELMGGRRIGLEISELEYDRSEDGAYNLFGYDIEQDIIKANKIYDAILRSDLGNFKSLPKPKHPIFRSFIDACDDILSNDKHVEALLSAIDKNDLVKIADLLNKYFQHLSTEELENILSQTDKELLKKRDYREILEILKVFYSVGINPSTFNSNLGSLFLLACESNNIQLAKSITDGLSRGNPSKYDPNSELGRFIIDLFIQDALYGIDIIPDRVINILNKILPPLYAKKINKLHEAAKVKRGEDFYYALTYDYDEFFINSDQHDKEKRNIIRILARLSASQYGKFISIISNHRSKDIIRIINETIIYEADIIGNDELVKYVKLLQK